MKKQTSSDPAKSVQQAPLSARLPAGVAAGKVPGSDPVPKVHSRKSAQPGKLKKDDEEIAPGAAGSEAAPEAVADSQTVAAVDGAQPVLLAEAPAVSGIVADGSVGSDAVTAETDRGANSSGPVSTSGLSVWGVLGAIGLGGVAIAGGGGGGSGSAKVADITPPTYQSMAVHSNGGVAGAGAIVLTYDEPIDAAHLPAASAFTVTINGDVNPVAAISASGNTVTLTLAAPVLAGNLSVALAYRDPSVGDDASAIQDAAGNDAAALSISTVVVADGYIRGAQMYLDAPGGLQALDGVVSDENGNFFLPDGKNPYGYALVAVGGVNIDTGLPNTANLKAPAGATTINPLTTLVAAVMASTESTDAGASAGQVAAALGLSLGSGDSLLNYDPIKANDTGVQKVAAQVATVIALAVSEQTSAALKSDVAANVVGNLADVITGASTASTTISLSDSTVLSQALNKVSVSAAVQSTIADATTVISTAASVAAISAAQSQFLDTIAPAAPVSLSVAGIGNDTTPTVIVRLNVASLDGKAAVAGDKLILMSDGVEVGSATLDAAAIASGRVEITAIPLAEGAHSFTAKLIDQSGNTGITSTAATSRIDTQAPTAVISADDGKLNIVFSEAVSGFSTSGLGRPDGLALGTLSGPVTLGDGSVKYSIGYTVASGVTAGDLRITASSYKDVAGNDGAASNTLPLADIARPVVAIKSVGSGADPVVSGQAGDKVIKGSGAANLTVTIKSGGNTLGTATTDADGQWAYTLTDANLSTLGQGGDSITAEQTRTTGSGTVTGTSAAFAFSVDTVAPTLPTIANVATNDIINGAEKTAGVRIAGTAEAYATVVLTLASGVVKQLDADATGNWSYTLTDGDYKAIGSGKTLSVVATDAAGNRSDAAARVIAVDTAAPTLTPFALSATSDSGARGDGLTSTTAAVVQFVAESGSTVRVLNGEGELGTAVENGTTGQFSYTFGNGQLSEGSNAISIRASDAAGNTTTRSGTLTLDTTAPSISSAAVLTAVDENSGAGQTVYTVKASDANGVLGYSLKAGADASVFSIDSKTGAVRLIANPDHETRSSYVFTVVATDAAGNQAERALTLEVNNVAEGPPVISSAATVSFAENGTGTVLTVVATANAAGAIRYSLSGTDAALFTIDADTGAITFKSAPNFEAAADSGGNNVHDIVVTATEAGNAMVATQAVAITVTNLAESSTPAPVTVADGKTYTATPNAVDIFEISSSRQMMATISGFEPGDVLKIVGTNFLNVDNDPFGDAVASLKITSVAGDGEVLIDLVNLNGGQGNSDLFGDVDSFNAIYGPDSIQFFHAVI